jgi:hypothetical protein
LNLKNIALFSSANVRRNKEIIKIYPMGRWRAGIFHFDPVTQYMVKNEICYKRTARDALI